MFRGLPLPGLLTVEVIGIYVYNSMQPLITLIAMVVQEKLAYPANSGDTCHQSYNIWSFHPHRWESRDILQESETMCEIKLWNKSWRLYIFTSTFLPFYFSLFLCLPFFLFLFLIALISHCLPVSLFLSLITIRLFFIFYKYISTSHI